MSEVAAIIISAGESTRMGRLKALLPWHGLPLIEYQISNLLQAGIVQIIVVLGYRYEELSSHVKGLGVKYVVNHNYKLGKTTSIKAGIDALKEEVSDILILSVDQPRPAPLIYSLINTHKKSQALITSPRYGKRGGHPVIFSVKLRKELEAIDEKDQGLRKIFDVRRSGVNEVCVEDSIIHLDLNTYEDYLKAQKLYYV